MTQRDLIGHGLRVQSRERAVDDEVAREAQQPEEVHRLRRMIDERVWIELADALSPRNRLVKDGTPQLGRSVLLLVAVRTCRVLRQIPHQPSPP